ncbi:anti-sigma-D factor RsdA [Rhodococcus sp. T2V]|uniref:anti-sigma-D factor RsdA n=1 Tax=Rhodococcus sp. T2V TaxID=3034164 RepID=UPI0023E2AF14|nr:anti-sigma-D factor RsdA [Rhodococcus sp. T2V]MDF3313560.1 anti-sigma-D factor RsdA [Rhodococcus sp. T2V]
MRGLASGIKRNGNPDADLPGDDAPVDVAAVRRDDALIEAIAGGGPVATDSPEQDQLALLLTNWRADIVSTPMPTGPLLDDVIAAIDASDNARSARSAARGKLRLLRPIAGAAAAIAVVMGGATIFSYNAEPGDPLWSVKSVVFSQQADSTVAQIDTTSQLQEAERLIATGDAESAKNLLESAADRAGGVRDADMRNELDAWRAKLAAEVEKIAPTTPPATTVPGTTTTGAPTQTAELPATLPGTPGSTTAPGVGQLPGPLPTDLQIPGLPPTSLPPVPTLPPQQLPLPPETLPSTSPEPPITVVPPPQPPLPVPSDIPTTQPPLPVPPDIPTTQPPTQLPPPEPSSAPLPPQEPSSAPLPPQEPSSAPLPLPVPTS